MWYRRRFVLLLLLGVSVPTAGQVVGGGGPTATDCWVTFDSIPAPNRPASRPNSVRCRDQDVACGDADPALGQCQFSVQIALNSTGFANCSPSAFPANSFAIPYSGPANDDHPKHVPDFEPLQQFVDGELPLGSGDVDRLSGYQPVTVTLPIRFSARGPRFRPMTLRLDTEICQIPLISGRCPSPLGDKDRFKLICDRPLDPMTSQPISPCTGVTSTFQQIQEHIFDRKCSNLATCHGSVEPSHDLCLKPSCGGSRSAYTDLVNVPPHNFAAASDGLKRVDPGNLENSLLYRKILGSKKLDSPNFGGGAYGFRMPYHNPAADRARPRLRPGEKRLLRDWILAGAPQTGFISSPYSCQ